MFQQLKKRRLAEFVRVERERIIKARPPEPVKSAQGADDVTSSVGGRPSTAATTNMAKEDYQEPNLNLKIMTEDQRKKAINAEFMDYVGTFVTKNEQKKVLPGTVKHAKEEQKRRELMNQIRPQEDEDDVDLEVVDVANYVQKQLYIGWKTTNEPCARDIWPKPGE